MYPAAKYAIAGVGGSKGRGAVRADRGVVSELQLHGAAGQRIIRLKLSADDEAGTQPRFRLVG
jgi:hypothetical protein